MADLTKVSEIKPYPANAKKHTKKQIEMVANSIKRFGFVQPIVIDKDHEVVIGHCRLEAAKILGLEEVPTVSVDNLTKEEVKALRLADNKLNESDWDINLVIEDLKELDNDLFNLTGFDKDLLVGENENDDEIPEDVPVVSKLGDLWVLGGHRVLCGDSTVKENVEKLMDGKSANMCFTDPPYNVDYGNTMKEDTLRYHTSSVSRGRTILNDKMSDEDFDTFLSASMGNVLKYTDGGIYVCMSSSEMGSLQDAFKAMGGHWSTFIIWAKNTFTMGRADYQRQFEPILYGWRDGVKERYWCGDRNQGDVWNFNRPIKSDLHPTMKPVELVQKAVMNSSEINGIVLDLFLGSGTTVIASQKTDRICYGMELDPHYVDVIIQRWCDYTGIKDVIRNGEKFKWV